MLLYDTGINASLENAEDFPADTFEKWGDFSRYYSTIEFIKQKDKVRKALEILRWARENGIKYNISWRIDQPPYLIYEQKLVIEIPNQDDAVHFKLTWC